jgi:RNA polymerase sigma-70 factor (ECF subfamily)
VKPEVTDTSLPTGEALRGRETDVFNILVERYSMRIYHHLRRMTGSHNDADDLVQETYIRVWKALPEFRGDSEWFTWIYRIATNLCLSFLEKQRRMPLVEFESSHANGSVYSDELDGKAVLKRLNDAIALLPEKQRAVFCMRYFDEMSYEQISAVTSTSVGALKASYHHAVKKLEDYLTHPRS